MAKLAALLLALFWTAGLAAQPALEFGRYHALVIGNNEYKHLPRLKTAIADAQGIADVLGQQYGFEVELLLNADRDQMIRAIGAYRNLGEDDNLLIYYAGHGVLDEASERGFWMPVDAEQNNEARWVDVAVVTGNLRAMNARHIMVVADSCYSGTLTRSAPAALPRTTDRTAWLKRMMDRRARVAMVSGGLEPVMDGGGSGHSVFARSLINTLRDNQDIIQGAELFEQLRGRVVVNSTQTPAYDDIRLAGHEGGDFIFVPRGQPPAAAASGADAAMDLAFWQSIQGSTNPADYRAYLQSFPQGRFAPLARMRTGEAAPPPAAAARPQAAPPPVAATPARPQAAPAAKPTGPAVAALTLPPPKTAPAPKAPEPAPPKLAAAPPSAAAGALADAAAFDRGWQQIRERLHSQYDRTWRFYEGSNGLEAIHGREIRAITAEAVEIDLHYRVESALQNGRREDRVARIRFRNKSPEFEVLDWQRR